ncbi:MAG TPA: hypothetical protein VNY24_11345 [Candidatus Acidoferrales bacterium]|jgi:hypothetical protein|nr:hypothetical protein [Candidatus Acidoferrales bacterium]
MKLFELKLRLIAPFFVLCCFVCLGSQQARAQATTSIIALPGISCTQGPGQLCTPPYTTAVNLTQMGPITINFTASSGHCSSIEVHVSLDGTPVTTSAILGPGQSTGPIILASSASTGSHTIGVQAEGVLGGCNNGTLASWTGTLAITAITGDQCSAPTVGTGTGVVGSANGAKTCGVLITVTAVDASGSATAFTATATGNGNPYDGTEDTLVGVQNNSGATLNSIPLSSPNTTFGGLFSFDFDGPCAFNANDCFGPATRTGYEGPDNTFTITNATSGTANFITGIPNGGSTWFALEGTPQSLTTVAITQPASATSPVTYTFNAGTNQTVEQIVDLSHSGFTAAQLAGINVTVTDSPIKPADFPRLVAFTSFAVDQCFIMQGELTSPTAISNVAITSNVLTLTVGSTAGLAAGQQVGLSGLTSATFLNGVTITITAVTATTVTANFTHADYTSASDTGTLGFPACKQYQILCTTSTNSTPSGANCPVSTARNEFYEAVFAPAVASTLAGPSLLPVNGFPTAVAYPMAIDTWPGGNCVFPDATLAGDLCPLNLLTTFSSVGDPTYTTTITTKNPNSTVIPTYNHPEQQTTVTVVGQNGAGWNNASNSNPVVVNFSTQAPFVGAPASNNNFVPAPIQSVDFWVDQSAPDTNNPPVSAMLATPTGACPAPSTAPPTPPTMPLPPFVSTGTLSGLSDGSHTLGYFSTDCAGTEELQFAKPTGGNWMTSFLTKPIKIDTVAPMITITTPPSNAAYALNHVVKAIYTCTDALSGILFCTGTVPYGSNIYTASGGPQTFVVNASDVAGNPATLSVNYTVVPYNAFVQQPINPDGSSVFNASRGVIPVKFTLNQNNVATCALPAATIALTRTAGGTLGAIDESVYLLAADSGSNFRISGCQYIYNLASGSLGPGSYEVDIIISGAVVGSGFFALK